MPTFITIGYGDQDGYERLDVAVRASSHAHDDQLRAAGVRMGVAGVPVHVRNHDAVAHGVAEVWPLSDTHDAMDRT